jgi:sulfur relay protein TusB/DsrH
LARILYFVTDMDSTSIRLALEHKGNEVGICLLQDAVYLGCKGKNENRTLAEAIKRGIKTFAAKKDIELRGLTELINPEIKVLGYGEIIDLILNYKRIINI